MGRIWSLAAVFGLTFMSGVLDAKGFFYAGRAWPSGQLDAKIGALSLLCFVGGLSMYIVAVRFMQGVGVTGVALQAGLWFIVTAVGLAIMDASVLQWSRAQQAVGLAVAAGLGWLIATTSAASGH